MISVTSSSIYIDGGSYSFEDVFKKVANSYYRNKAKKIGDRSYFFDFDFYIGKDSAASLEDENVSVEVTSSYFQVYENSFFRLGSKQNNKVLNGCYFYAPNLSLGYGFGCKKKDDIYTLSGNLFLYGSYIEAPCFWGFFNSPDKQLVEIEDCLIIGFGRISGNNSYVKNTKYLNAKTKYGSISVLGKIGLLKNISVNNVSDDGYALYFNPAISGDCVIEDFRAHNYNNLIYCESHTEKKTLSLINPVIDGLNVYFEDNKSTIIVKNRINFKYTNENIIIKITYQDETIDMFVLKDRNYTDLIYIEKNKDREIRYKEYSITINNSITFSVVPNKPFTIDVDSYLDFENNNTTSDASPSVYLIPDKNTKLESIFSFFINSKIKPNVELRKSNNNKIEDPYEVVQIGESLYRVSFLIGELAEESSTGEIWQDGIYLLYCKIQNNVYWESVKVSRVEEEDDTEDTTTDDTSIVIENDSSGAKIFM